MAPIFNYVWNLAHLASKGFLVVLWVRTPHKAFLLTPGQAFYSISEEFFGDGVRVLNPRIGATDWPPFVWWWSWKLNCEQSLEMNSGDTIQVLLLLTSATAIPTLEVKTWLVIKNVGNVRMHYYAVGNLCLPLSCIICGLGTCVSWKAKHAILQCGRNPQRAL